ncbi:SoxR reducing system RseC family protein [Nitrogeniibacter mangrovi]|uniref:SoxR reducing system RseC family protein n=1 Tax=Nitrogeniibacter mangrovi TaxID=2016596 RepID=A0A6C1BAQ0_9RHOO|nr:SoxR reducing system RseC family protein [Nitrogeniibacter mangrovi]QID19470.1 SoxR reducing system RseC family protein [Nitrogeniibacter mangrovi]
MNVERLAHAGVVQSVDGDHALVVMDTGGCAACGHGSHCGVGQMAAGRAATVLRVPATRPLRAGERVTVSVPVHALTVSAVLGYVLPAVALLVGAGLGQAAGSDRAAVLGAAAGFFGAMAAGRALMAAFPALRVTPRLESPHAPPVPKEFSHD